MYKYIPQKRRSQFRIKLGCVFYTFKRYFYWIKFSIHFAKVNKAFIQDGNISEDKIKDQFPYLVFSHSSPLYRNLSKEDMELQEGKVQNLNIAFRKISGVQIEPGKLFSYWRLIGNPTKAKGYTTGMILENGKPSKGTGGGLCALSNLIYWIALHSELSVKERFRHSYDVFPDSNRTIPFGSGATCVYNFRDLMIYNETEASFVLYLNIEKDRLCGRLYSNKTVTKEFEVYEKEHKFTQEAAGIYVRHNVLCRKVYEKNAEGKSIQIDDTFITENHALMMYNPLLSDKPINTEK